MSQHLRRKTNRNLRRYQDTNQAKKTHCKIVAHETNLLRGWIKRNGSASSSAIAIINNKPRFHIQVEIKLRRKQRTPFWNVSIHSCCGGGSGGGGAVKLSLYVCENYAFLCHEKHSKSKGVKITSVHSCHRVRGMHLHLHLHHHHYHHHHTLYGGFFCLRPFFNQFGRKKFTFTMWSHVQTYFKTFNYQKPFSIHLTKWLSRMKWKWNLIMNMERLWTSLFFTWENCI